MRPRPADVGFSFSSRIRTAVYGAVYVLDGERSGLSKVLHHFHQAHIALEHVVEARQYL
jgi:hypothetical protein